MKLYEEKKFELDDDVSNYLPFDLKNPNFPDINISFKMLLSNRSSLIDFDSFCHQIPGDPDVSYYPNPYLRDVLLSNGRIYLPTVWSENEGPGETFLCSNAGFGIIEYLVECISGKSFNDFCKQNIFSKLNMKDTSFRLNDLDTKRVAIPYEYQRKPNEFKKYQKGIYKRQIHYGWIPYGSANLRSTIEDLSHFLIAHMNNGYYNEKKLLEGSTIELMHKNHYPNQHTNWGKSTNYGLGIIIHNKLNSDKIKSIGHWGVPYNRMFFKPAEKTGVIIFMNVMACPLSNNLSFRHKISGMKMFGIIKHIESMLFKKAKKL